MARTKVSGTRGWQQIAGFLGRPISVAQRWAKSGMPVTRHGRRVQALPVDLNRWLGRESAGEPVQIAPETTDLAADLMHGLSYVRQRRVSQNEFDDITSQRVR
jgi:hypothetical protein